MAQQATSRTIDVVTSVWQLVLRRSSIGICDNFFEIGGTPQAAADLCCEIERRLGRQIPPVAIYQTPTINSLTEALQGSSFPTITPLIQLKSGGSRAPLYIAHGIGGTVLEFFELVKHMDSSHAIYGLQAKGSDGMSEPLDRIEDMAEFHLKEIRNVQPSGPYFLAGHSLGGLVALEIARRVLENGEDPGVLAMIDSYPHLRHLAPAQQVRLIGRLAARRAFGAKISPEAGKHGKGTHLEVPAQIETTWRRLRECDYKALERYQPRFYSGTIHFVRADVASIFPGDPAAVWGHFAKEFKLDTVPGDHFEMLTTHAAALGSLLSRYARELGK